MLQPRIHAYYERCAAIGRNMASCLLRKALMESGYGFPAVACLKSAQRRDYGRPNVLQTAARLDAAADILQN